MSAVTAIYYFDRKPLPAAAVEAMNDCLKHRGEDATGVWTDKNVGFGHRMRWTTEESLSEKLPRKSRNSPCVITCDARIDNRSELIPQLGFEGINHKEISDSAVVLAAYEKWGKDCLPKLIGDFVFAVWNPQTKEIFCARDPLGVKHFYYYYEPNKIFALASEIKALFCLSEIPRELNEEHLGDYLVYNFEDKENTFFKQIKRLPATHAMLVGENNLRIWRYWKPEPKKEIRLRNHREYQEAFREKFTEAVACRTRSAFPVGSFLSGGLDSSSIVCVAAPHLANQSKPLHSFSAVFPTVSKLDSRIDEMSFMRSVIEKTGCQAHFVNCDDANPLKDIKKMMWHADHPLGVPNAYIDWEIFKKAKRQGVRVLLSGIDGDSTVSHGYSDFTQFAKRGQWWRMFNEARLLKKNMPRREHSIRSLAVENGLANVLPANLDKVWRLLRLKKATKDVQKFDSAEWRTVNRELKKKYKLEERKDFYVDLSYPEKSTDIESHWNDLTCGVFAFMLESYENIAQAHSIEARFPFFDRRLIEFCIALPPGQRIYKGWTRAIFRNAMSGTLPEDVRLRTTKADLGAGVRLNLLEYGLSDLEDVVNVNSWVLEKYINVNELEGIYQHHRENPLKGRLQIILLTSTIHLSQWLRETGFAFPQPSVLRT